jgi:predicted alpha/beta-fold hydrolase
MLTENAFKPPWYLRNGHVQTILASSPFRAWGKSSMRHAARQVILTTPDNVRLLGLYSPQGAEKSGGEVI